MAITVKHTKVSSVPDSADTSLVRPSDWNADHTLTGLGTMAEQNANNVTITGGSISGATVSGYIPTTEKGAALGVATLDSAGKVPTSQIPLQGDLNYQGAWNATTNSPTLTSSVGTQGYYYVVNVAGTTDLNGITDWQIGDWAIFNGSVWQKVDNTDAVTSVHGQVGTVVLTTTNIAEGTNEYYTDTRARAALSAGTGISYANTTGVITNSAPDQTVVLTAGTGISTSGTYPNFTITNTSPSLGGDVVGPSSATDNAIARYDTTTGKLIQNSVVTISDTGAIAGATHITDIDYVDFNTSFATTLGAGQMGWDGYNTLGLGMFGGNVIQHIGEDTFFYVKASSAITKGQLCMFTGAVGSSGVLTAAPSNTIPYAEAIMGIAAENIALNAFGLVQITGTLKGVNTSAFLDGDVLYYNSAVTGGLTKTYPTSGPIVIVAAVANSGSGGSGVLTVRVSFQTRVVSSTGISVTQTANSATITNTAPDKIVSLTGAGTTTISGTYPSFTITSNDQYTGTVTAVTGTSPISSSGGTTPAISISQANGSTNGYLSSTDWTTFNNKGSGSVTSVAASVPSFLSVSGSPITTTGTLAISYSGTALPIANGGTNATSYTAPSGNVSGLVFYNGTSLANDTTVGHVGYDTVLNMFTARAIEASNGIICNSRTIATNFTIPSGDSAMSTGPITINSGVTVTVPSGGKWVIL